MSLWCSGCVMYTQNISDTCNVMVVAICVKGYLLLYRQYNRAVLARFVWVFELSRVNVCEDVSDVVKIRTTRLLLNYYLIPMFI